MKPPGFVSARRLLLLLGPLKIARRDAKAKGPGQVRQLLAGLAAPQPLAQGRTHFRLGHQTFQFAPAHAVHAGPSTMQDLHQVVNDPSPPR